MTTYTLKSHIESPGTPYKHPDGTITKSQSGHIWFQVIAPDGSSFSAGFGPENTKSGPTPVQGTIFPNDGSAYQGEPIFTTTHQITEAQANILDRYRNDPASFGFDKDKYNALSNSCVDFYWKGMSEIGMNPRKQEGELLPMDNISELQKLVNPQLPAQISVPRDLYATPMDLLESLQVRPFSAVDIYLSNRPPLGAPPEPQATVTVGPLSPEAELIRKYNLRPLSPGDCLIWNLDPSVQGIDPGDHSVCRAYYSGSAQ